MSRNSTISIYSPEGLAETSAEGALVNRLASLTGRRISVLDNGKSGAKVLLGRMAERLAARTRGEFVGIRQKGSAATPCEDDVRDALIAESDLVLTGTAD